MITMPGKKNLSLYGMVYRSGFSLFVFVFIWLVNPFSGKAAGDDVLVVSPDGPYTSISAALGAAHDGALIEVHGGVYPGPLIVEKSVQLIGINWPVIDGNGKGTVVQLLSPDSLLQGFVIRNSGSSLDEENSGIAGEAPGLVISGNRLEDTLFGIYLRKAEGSILRDNIIHGKHLDLARRGDPIRVWYSNDVLIENNTIKQGRDVVLWYSEQLTVRYNSVEEGRYGLHFMYCDDAWIEQNRLLRNSVGTFMMYSRRLHLIHNTIAYNHGPSGYGIGMKDMDDAVVEENLFLENRIGVYLDNSPREVDSIGTISGNVFAFNDIGISLLPSVRHNHFSKNSFIENGEQVQIDGNGLEQNNLWSVNGIGNFWSDYAGYDQDQNGVGDLPYRSERLFENLIDRNPNLRILLYSPSIQAVDFAAKAVPLVRPQPKLVDEDPLMAPRLISDLPIISQSKTHPLPWISTGMLGVALLLIALTHQSNNNGKPHLPNIFVKEKQTLVNVSSLIVAENLSKQFGAFKALDNISFKLQAGEAVALWGPNGAGKTTALRCLLGLLPYQGKLSVGGYDVKHAGKKVRQLIGFVPQECNFHPDLTVQETLAFYGRLKSDTQSSSQEGAVELLARVGLQDHLHKLAGELSGGMRQRLALSVALLGNPQVLVLDEPTANLDVRAREELLERLLMLKALGQTILFSSHRLEEIVALADRVLILENGRLLADCPPAELNAQAGWRVTLHLRLKGDLIQAALKTLETNGLAASQNGTGIRVKVAPGHKGLPIGLLEQAGIAIEDFDVEHSEIGQLSGE